MPDDLDGYAALRAAVETPISGGEHEFTRYGFRELIERGCVDILQPDVNRCGGITEARKIWAMAAAHDLPVIPHAGQMHNHHLVMAHMNSPFAEYFPPPDPGVPPDPNETFWRVFRGDPVAQRRARDAARGRAGPGAGAGRGDDRALPAGLTRDGGASRCAASVDRVREAAVLGHVVVALGGDAHVARRLGDAARLRGRGPGTP